MCAKRVRSFTPCIVFGFLARILFETDAREVEEKNKIRKSEPSEQVRSSDRSHLEPAEVRKNDG